MRIVKSENPQSTAGGNGGDDLSERIARLEERAKYLATKEDVANVKLEISSLKIWILTSAFSAIATLLGLALLAIKVLSG